VALPALAEILNRVRGMTVSNVVDVRTAAQHWRAQYQKGGAEAPTIDLPGKEIGMISRSMPPCCNAHCGFGASIYQARRSSTSRSAAADRESRGSSLKSKFAQIDYLQAGWPRACAGLNSEAPDWRSLTNSHFWRQLSNLQNKNPAAADSSSRIRNVPAVN
jgi:hypothetical protein